MNSITTLKTDIQLVMDKARGASTPLALIFFLFIAIFGIYPDADLFWAHCRIAEWAVLTFVVLTFIKNVWLKAYLLVSLISLVTVSLTYPKNAGASAFIYFYYLFLFGMLFQILHDSIKKKDLGFIVNGLCVIAIIQTAYIWLQHFKLDPILQGWMDAVRYKSMDIKDLVVGTWGHTNFSGAYLACSIPLFLRRKWCLFIPFLALALLWGRSWGAILSLAAAIIFWVMFTQTKRMKVLITLLACLSVIAYGSFFEHRQFNPFRSDRLQYLRPTVELIGKRPIQGWGLGQYKSAFLAISKNVLHTRTFNTHAHFDPLENAFELGILGTIPVIGFLISIFIHFLRNITEISVVAMSGITALSMNSCSTFLFRTPLAWVFLVLTIVVLKERKNVDPLHG